MLKPSIIYFVFLLNLGNLAYNIFRGPIEIVLGIAVGVIVGPLLWILPFNYKVCMLTT